MASVEQGNGAHEIPNDGRMVVEQKSDDSNGGRVGRAEALERQGVSERSRSWTFTYFKGEGFDIPDANIAEALGGVYTCFQHEVCPSTNRYHIQGYLRLKSQGTFQAVAKRFAKAGLGGAHLEVAHGTDKQNKDYCSKSESRQEGTEPFEKGVPASQGKRTDLDEVRELIKEKPSMKRVCKYASSYQALRSAELILKYHEPKRIVDDEHPLRVLWFHGATGTGKTREAFNIDPKAYITAPNSKWFDGYDAHKTIIVDDLRANTFPFPYLLRLLDRYPIRIEHKGGSRQLMATTVIVTCPWDPTVLFRRREEAHSEDIAQLTRRITEIRLFGDSPVAPPEYANDSHVANNFVSLV